MALQTFQGEMVVSGRVSPTTLDIPDETLDDDDFSAFAALVATKLQHRYQAKMSQALVIAAAETRTIAIARANGNVTEFVAGSVTPCTGDATITVELRTNTVVVATITLDKTLAGRTIKVGTLVVGAAFLDAGDWLEVVITPAIGSGTLGSGLFCTAQIDVNDLATFSDSLDFSVTSNSQYLPSR